MDRSAHLIRVTCPRRKNKTEKEIGWLHQHVRWPCENPICAGWLHFNLNELDKFARDEATNFGSEFRLKKFPEEPL